ncbi:hypothetical protein DEO45_00850 [Rhodanobacter denitrificans]|uniref:MipA/OmpV family protein n=1 Tax=Rhodanobacter denitrificans TaxID=666685 RepID=A0A368KL48_9GAMM|nr:hypothetical protein [Rhodanobacter denitrificans]RCS31695.1 hypothetical protein DEO45_00850 [Rhodanobacter denitrificans]
MRPRQHVARGGLAIRAGFAALLIGACLPPVLHAQSATFDGAAALSSQLVDRGQAMTSTTPILQGAASWTFPAGWSLGLSASAEARSPGGLVAALAQASRHWSLSGDWQMQANLLYYRYAGTARSRAFARAETGLGWSYRDVLTFGLSAIHVIGRKGRHRLRGAADISFHWPLARDLSLSVGAGAAQSPIAPYDTYGYGHADDHEYGHAGSYSHLRNTGIHTYGHVGLLWSRGPWRIEIDRILADPETRRQWDVMGASPWVATLSRSF